MKSMEKTFEHPSYGMLNFSRVSCSGIGGGMRLFGSDIGHSNMIKLTISEADMQRKLSRNWYHSKGRLIEVFLSYAQFATAIGSMNTEGTPCTLKWHRGVGAIEEPPLIDTKSQFEKEAEQTIDKTAEFLDDALDFAKSLMEKKSVSKKDRESLISKLETASINMKSNVPFVKKSVKKSIDNTVSDAKSEIEAFMLHKALGDTGMVQILHEEPIMIEDSK